MYGMELRSSFSSHIIIAAFIDTLVEDFLLIITFIKTIYINLESQEFLFLKFLKITPGKSKLWNRKQTKKPLKEVADS